MNTQPDLEPIWQENEKRKARLKQLFPVHVWEPKSTPHLDISPLIERGLALCD